MFDFILQDNTLTEYPVATIIHWLQGILVGWLVMRSPSRWHYLAYAIIATACFLAYESLEQARIGDRGDVDVLNFVVMVHTSAGVTALVRYIRGRRSLSLAKKRIERDYENRKRGEREGDAENQRAENHRDREH